MTYAFSCNKVQKLRVSTAKLSMQSVKRNLPIFMSGLLGFAASSLASTTLTGEVTVSPKDEVPTASTTALYITVREDVGLWTSAVRNIKPPPVLTKRIPVTPSSFPYKYTLNSDFDSTPEGAQTYSTWSSGKNLLISVRVDEDGIAATRGPNDLVGKGNSEREKDTTQWRSTNVEVVGRGVAGKILLGK